MWNEQDPTWQEYLLYGRDSDGTLTVRRTALRKYLEFYKEHFKKELTLEEIVEMAKESDITLEKAWLLCCKKMLKTLAPNTVNMYGALIRSYLGWWGMRFSKRARLPLAVTTAQERIENKKYEYRPPDVKKLIDVVSDLRDRTMILFFFQGGIDLSTAFSLKYGDVAEQLESGQSPLLIHAKRPKSQFNFRFCIGSDAINALKVYINDRKMVRYTCVGCNASWRMPRQTCTKCGAKTKTIKEDVDYDEPLFVTHDGKKRAISKSTFESRMRRYVAHGKIVDPRRMKRADFNIAGTHALRAAFSSILQYHGMNQVIIDGFQGHKVAYDSAYSRLSDRELIELYSKFEEHLMVSNAEAMMTLREEMLEMKRKMKEMEEREINRATNLAGLPSDPVKVALYKRLLALVESDTELLQDYGR